jgi:hypothetical protein
MRPDVVRALILASGEERLRLARELDVTSEELAAAVHAWLGLATLVRSQGAGPDPLAYTYTDLRRIIVMGQAAELLTELFPRWITEPGLRASDVLKTASPDVLARAERILRDLTSAEAFTHQLS